MTASTMLTRQTRPHGRADRHPPSQGETPAPQHPSIPVQCTPAWTAGRRHPADTAGCLRQSTDLPAHCPDLPQASALASRLCFPRGYSFPRVSGLLASVFLPCLPPLPAPSSLSSVPARSFCRSQLSASHPDTRFRSRTAAYCSGLAAEA